MQASINGDGLDALRFHLVALAAMGAAGTVAGTKLFRWDSGQRFLAMPGKAWALVAVASWVIVGAVAVQRGELAPRPGTAAASAPSLLAVVASPDGSRTPGPDGAPSAPPESRTSSPSEPASAVPLEPTGEAVSPRPADAGTGTGPSATTSTPGPTASASTARAATSGTGSAAEPWRALTEFDFAALPIAEMPADDGNISPVAEEDERPAGGTATDLQRVVDALPGWAPGHVADRAQRVRNYLLILAVADFAQSPLERFLPRVVMTHLLTEFSRQDLAQLLCWVALHSDEGDLSALDDPLLVRLGAATLDRDELRLRTYYYGVKLTRRVVGF
jgi:hypothetical protein